MTAKSIHEVYRLLAVNMTRDCSNHVLNVKNDSKDSNVCLSISLSQGYHFITGLALLT
jgi:hypothetical protein